MEILPLALILPLKLREMILASVPQQNHIKLCAGGFKGTVENIPWSQQGPPSTKFADQKHYPALIVDIQSLAKENHCFRDEVTTSNHTQLVLNSLKPGEEIGLEGT